MRWPFIVLVSAAMSIRLYGSLCAPAIVLDRSQTYIQPARRLVREGSLADPETLRRPPTYIAFLAAAMRASPDFTRTAIRWQHILGGLLVALLGCIAWLTFRDPPTALMAGAMAAVYPRFLYFESAIESESLFIFLAAAAILLYLLALLSRRLAVWSAAGTCSGVATLCRPEFCFFFAVPLLLGRLHKRSHVELLTGATPHLLIVLAWMTRNAFVFGAFTLSVQGSITSLQTTGPWIDWASPTHAGAKQAYREAYAEKGRHAGAANLAIARLLQSSGRCYVEDLKEMAALGRQTALRHPLRLLAGTASNMVAFIWNLGGDLGESAWWYRAWARWLIPIHFLFAWTLLPLAALGVWKTAKTRPLAPETALVLLSGAYLLIANCAVEPPNARRALELEPLALIFYVRGILNALKT